MIHISRGVALVMFLTLAPIFPAQAQLAQVSAAETRTQELVEHLKELIRGAEQNRRSDPAMIRRLRELVRHYDWPWKVSLLYDDFRDGDYTYNPRWNVTQGEFRIARGSGLRSYFDSPTYPARHTTSRRSDDTAIDVLGDLLLGTREREAEPTPATIKSEAEIFTRVSVTNAFVVRTDLNIRDFRDRDTRIEFGPYQGDDRRTGYRLAYEYGRKPSLTLLRFSPGRSAVIEMTDRDINLSDGKSHTVEWRRTMDGEMIVLLDNQEIIKTVDRAYNDPFDGFAMINKGGDFEVERIAIFGTRQ